MTRFRRIVWATGYARVVRDGAIRNTRIRMDPKADIKKRLGNSPDRADAYVNGLYALDLIDGELVGKRDSYSDPFADCYEDDGYVMKDAYMAM